MTATWGALQEQVRHAISQPERSLLCPETRCAKHRPDGEAQVGQSPFTMWGLDLTGVRPNPFRALRSEENKSCICKKKK